MFSNCVGSASCSLCKVELEWLTIQSHWRTCPHAKCYHREGKLSIGNSLCFYNKPGDLGNTYIKMLHHLHLGLNLIQKKEEKLMNNILDVLMLCYFDACKKMWGCIRDFRECKHIKWCQPSECFGFVSSYFTYKTQNSDAIQFGSCNKLTPGLHITNLMRMFMKHIRYLRLMWLFNGCLSTSLTKECKYGIYFLSAV